jgi:hypothetical protein
MATWGPGPFENEFAWDLIADLKRKSVASAAREISGILREAVEDTSALVTGEPRLTPIEPENMAALIDSYGSVERAEIELGAIRIGDLHYLASDDVSVAQKAAACAEILRIALHGEAQPDTAPEVVAIAARLRRIDLRELTDLAFRAVTLISRSQYALDRWFEAEPAADLLRRLRSTLDLLASELGQVPR